MFQSSDEITFYLHDSLFHFLLLLIFSRLGCGFLFLVVYRPYRILMREIVTGNTVEKSFRQERESESTTAIIATGVNNSVFKLAITYVKR